MASLLAKFRIDYTDLQLIPDITAKPKQSTTEFFSSLIEEFRSNDDCPETGKQCVRTKHFILKILL